MRRRSIWTGLFALALAAGCSGKKSQPQSQNQQTSKPPTSPPQTSSDDGRDNPKGAATAPKPPVPSPELVPLAADSGPSTGKLQWAAPISGPGTDAVRDAAIDAQGNVVITGYVSPGTDLGDGKPVEAHKVDAFVAKYGPTGELMWARSFGGKGEDAGNGVAFDGQGNVVVVGLFATEMSIGAERITGRGSDDAFIVKLGPDGSTLWARRFGGLDSDAAEDVVVTPDGKLVITGSFRGKVQAADITLESKGNEDIYLLALNAGGQLLWATQYGDRKLDSGYVLANDRQGNVVLLAEFSDTVSFGGPELTSNGNRDLALVKLDTAGNHIWSRSYGGPFNELGRGLAVDRAGNLVIAGTFDDEIRFGGNDTLRSRGESDVYVAKFDGGGAYQWSRSFGGKDEDIAAGAGVDKYGNVVVAGWYRQTVDFGGGALAATGANADVFLLKLSAEGQHSWSKRHGDRDHDQARALAVNDDGRIAIAGVFRFTLDLGGKALEGAREPDDLAPPADAFVAVFAP